MNRAFILNSIAELVVPTNYVSLRPEEFFIIKFVCMATLISLLRQTSVK
ncbi:hypothetical protein LEP1GSC071_4021 [Leptospira santarosai str. JET]|nr:hypothetical protein LEP1GSC071_4021 [Leptospira santarosai str. JET]